MNLSTVSSVIGVVDNDNRQGTLLTLLAEVASQKLHNESNLTPIQDMNTERSRREKHPIKLRWNVTDSTKITIEQLRAFSSNQLLKMFTILEGDEMKRTFYFQCKFLPSCGARFFSFGSEDKARHLVKQHLNMHLQDLEPTFIIEIPRKVPRKSTKPLKKLTIRSKLLEDGMLNNLKSGIDQVANPTLIKTELHNNPVELNHDHDYHIPATQFHKPQLHLVKVETTKQELPDYDICDSIEDNPSFTNAFEVPANLENLVEVPQDFMSTVTQEVVIKTENVGYVDFQTTCANYIIPDNMQNEMLRPREKKPKGKAKFIGQSAEEREMAVEMIKALRKGSGELECQICKPPRFFTALTTLISHYKSHAGIKPYECVLCKAVFTRQHSLNYHLLIHLNQTRFTCEVCGRKFRHPSHFKEHQRRHTGESPFHCPDCSFRFKTRNTYKRHLKTRHGKLLTQSGTIVTLSEEEFKRIRTNPREKQHGELDKENSINTNNNASSAVDIMNGLAQSKVMKVLQKGNQQDTDIQSTEMMLNFMSADQQNNTTSLVLSTGNNKNSTENLCTTDSVSTTVDGNFFSKKLYISSVV